jgi:hypothetical protein
VRFTVAVWLALLPAVARAAEAPAGVEAGWRTGFAAPLGDAWGAPSGWPALPLGDVVTAALPVWIDAGYRFGPRLFLGAAFAYAHALVSGREGCPVVGLRCSASDIVAGAQVQYHPLPRLWLDPWVGLAVGYEALDVATQVSSGRFSGAEVVVQVGGDCRPAQTVGVGPFVMLGGGPFVACSNSSGTSCSVGNPGVHGWLTLGVRAAFDLPIGR